MHKLISTLEDYLDEYNLASTTTLNLVFFVDAVEHITRINRILRQPRGNAMLVGVGGSGEWTEHVGGGRARVSGRWGGVGGGKGCLCVGTAGSSCVGEGGMF